MGDFLDRLRNINPKGRVWGGRKAERATDLPLDHQLTFNPEPGEKWTFEEGRFICLNGFDVQELVHEGGNDVRILCGVNQGIHDYQQFVWTKGGKSNAKFNGTVASLQSTISNRLGSIYDGLSNGVRFECTEDKLWINNVNVCALLELYKNKPTQKTKQYLSGFRDKLALILSGTHHSTRYDGIYERARKVFDDITFTLEHVAPNDIHLLHDGRSNC